MDEQIIGGNIRALRKRKGRTLTALAAEADMAKGTLSKIETGQVSAPISSLMRIADALGVALAEFFVEAEARQPYVLTRRGEGNIITRDGTRFGYSYEALALPMPGKKAEPFLLTIAPGDPVGRFQHGGEEFIYMLAGRMEFTVADDRLVLRPGDSLYLDPTSVHTTRVLGTREAKFICVFIQEPTR